MLGVLAPDDGRDLSDVMLQMACLTRLPGMSLRQTDREFHVYIPVRFFFFHLLESVLSFLASLIVFVIVLLVSGQTWVKAR